MITINNIILNTIAKKLIEKFKLDKIKDYVFDDNELDKQMKDVKARLESLEKMAHPPKNFKCNYDKEK